MEAVRHGRIVYAFALGLAAACGGQSLVHSDDGDDGSNGGDGGTSGNSGGGSGNAGASGSTAGTSLGGTFTGGASSGGTFTGGVSFGGTGTGAVAGTGGTGGAAGAGGVCSLPIESGSCDAYIPSFGFSPMDGNCQPFVYGGCQGNANRFPTLSACEASCGGSLAQCPGRLPTMTRCSDEGQICSYSRIGCLCSPTANLSCNTIDPSCLNVDAGVSEIVLFLYTSCTCTDGLWSCQSVTSGGR